MRAIVGLLKDLMPGASEDTSFDDPDLKAAVKRVLGGDQVPANLRAQIEASLAAHHELPVNIPTQQSIPTRRNPWFSLAAAAVVLVSVGLIAWRLLSVTPGSTGGGSGGNGAFVAALPSLPQSFASALVKTHDFCTGEPDHHVLQGVPDDNFRLMSQKLRDSLGFPSLAAAAGDGWTFRGASQLCKVAGVRSAHLLFAKADASSLSIFSLPVSSQAWPDGTYPKDGARFANRETNHPILSWVHDDVVFSVVASSKGTINLNDIESIAHRLQNEAVAADHGLVEAIASRD